MPLKAVLSDPQKLESVSQDEKIKKVLSELKGKLSEEDLAAVAGGLVASHDSEFLADCAKLNKGARLGVTCCQNNCI